MYWTLGQAAKETGHDKNKIHRAIKAGKLSIAGKNGNALELDPSEVMRVFPKLDTSQTNELRQIETPANTIEHSLLVQEVKFLEEQIRTLKEEKDKTEKRLETSEAERREMLEVIKRQTFLLSPPSVQTELVEVHHRSWFRRLFGD
jgi:hypothetical protein